MIIREIKGYEYLVTIGESEVRETLKEEASDEIIDYIARIEETANDLLDLKYGNEDVEKREIEFAIDIITEMYNHIDANVMKKEDILKYFNEMYKKLEGWKNE